MKRFSKYHLLSVLICVAIAFSLLGVNALAQYSEDVYDAYTEYVFEYLMEAQNEDLITEEQVFSIMPLVSQ